MDENGTRSRCVHVRGRQRGRKLIENGDHLGQLAMTAPERCMLVAGALDHVRCSGGPARNIAFREK